MRLSTLRNLIRELKHQTLLIHEQHGSPRRTGSGTHFTRQMQIIKENNLTWNNHERQQNNSFENVYQRFAWSFVSFLRRKHDFRRRISTFVCRILFEEPRIWTSGFNMSTRVLKSVTVTQELLTCAVAVMLQKYFRLASVVPRTERLVLKFPIFRVHSAQAMFFLLAKKIRSTGWIFKPKL